MGFFRPHLRRRIRAALLQGLPVKRLVIGFTALGGAFAGLAGMFEVAAIGNANASLAAGYGATGILIAFLARQNPLAIIPFAILLVGSKPRTAHPAPHGPTRRDDAGARRPALRRRAPGQTLYGRFRIFQPEMWAANRGAAR